MTSRVEDRLKPSSREAQDATAAPSGIYLVCDNADRSLAKTIRSFLFNQRLPVEWTPYSLGAADLAGSAEHQKLLRRNSAHLVLHGETSEDWIQDRIRELNDMRRPGTPAPLQAIYLANPRRDDKEDILVREVALLEGYSPATVADVLKPYLDRMSGAAAVQSAGSSS